MDEKTIILLAITSIIFLIFGRFVKALFYDFLDLILSTLDNFVGGFAGLDIGDWAASIIILVKYRKIMGIFPALFVAWEASGFLPISFIPGVGEMVEVVTNLVPSTAIFYLFFNKYGTAEKESKELKKKNDLLKHFGKKSDEKTDRINKLILAENPVEAIKVSEGFEKEIDRKIHKIIMMQISETEHMLDKLIDTYGQEEMPKDLQTQIIDALNEIQKRINEARSLAFQRYDADDVKEALSIIDETKQDAYDFMKMFEDELKDYEMSEKISLLFDKD